MVAPTEEIATNRTRVVDALTDMSNCLQPPMGEQVGLYIEQAAAALGGNEASLARQLGVTRATVSSWKRRGLPERYAGWFRSALPEKIIVFRSVGATNVSIEARLAFLELVRRTGGELFTSPSHPALSRQLSASRMYGVLALADFVHQRLIAAGADASAERAASILEAALKLIPNSV